MANRVKNVRVTRMESGTLQKYMARAVGSRRIRDLIKYEMAVCLLRSFPGSVGIFLRQKLYPFLLGSYGRGAVFMEGVTLRCPRRLHAGDGVVIDERVYFDIKSEAAEVRIGARSQIMRGVSFETGYEGFICLGEDVFVGPYTILNGQGGLEIGKNALIAGHCYLVAGNHDFSDLNRPINQQDFISNGIVLEEDVWLGAGVKVLDGVRVGMGAVISAGAVITKDVVPYSIMAGVPARRIGERKTQCHLQTSIEKSPILSSD